MGQYLDAEGNIKGKRYGLKEIARRVPRAAGMRRAFKAEVGGRLGVWRGERRGRGLELLAEVAHNVHRDDRVDWHGVAARVAQARLLRDIRSALVARHGAP